MDTIFVSLACYRDSQVINTVIDCFNKAENPDLLTIGILWQRKIDEDECIKAHLMQKLPSNFYTKVKIIEMNWKKARGPIYARYVIFNELVEDEKYFLQLDSHSRFAQNWDTRYIKLLKELPEPNNSVLSNYPLGYHDGRPLDIINPVNEMFYKKIKEQVPIFRSSRILTDTNKHTFFWAAGNSFSTTQVFAQVPIDPYLKNLFWGEEFLTSIRLYTHGFDIYIPRKNLIYTKWSRENRPLFWELKDVMGDDFFIYRMASKKRMLYISGLEEMEVKDDVIPLIMKNAKFYGLGTKRTKDDFFEKSGLNEFIENADQEHENELESKT
jgi:[Skp1-protein]-hydroxyproline N-acetylglucosaminyltransferase